MTKIKNLLVIPLIASTVFLASPAIAANTAQGLNIEVRNITNRENVPNTKREGISGTVASIDGSILVVESSGDMEYTVDTAHATIMKSSNEKDSNPSIVHTDDIKIGDVVVVRGTLEDTE